VHFVDDVDLPGEAGRGVADRLAQLADVVDAAVARAVDLDHVHRPPGGDLAARAALVAGFVPRPVLSRARAVDRLGEDPRHRGLPDAAGSGEEVGVGGAAGPQGVAEGARDRLLAGDLGETLRAPLQCEDQVGHGSPPPTGGS